MAQAGDGHSEAARQLATLNRIARIAVQDLAIRPMLKRIVDSLADEFGWEFVACASIDLAHGEFVCEAVYSAVPSEISVGYRRALGSGIVGECAQTGLTIDIDDVSQSENFVETLDGVRAELCVPVVHNGEVLAVLNAESRQQGAFRGQRDLLETVANQVAGVLYAARLLDELQRANSQLQEAYKALESSSRLDALTGVANRRRFDYWLTEAHDIAVRTLQPMAVLLVDVDHFKAYNDGYGHLAGDSSLKIVARTLSDAIKDAGLKLARYGGEEFAVVVPARSSDEVLALAERMRRSVEEADVPHRFSPHGRLTISIGVAMWLPAAGDSPDAIVAAADVALYRAKDGGRNRVCVDHGDEREGVA